MTWTRLSDVRARLRKRWDNGTFLTAWANGVAWEPLSVPLRGPAAGELAAQFEAVRAWVQEWTEAQGRSGAFRLVLRSIGGRSIGANEIPARLVVEGYEDLWRLLDVRREVRRFTELREATASEEPRLVGWIDTHPMTVLANDGDWLKLVRTARWLEAARGQSVYLRQVPVPGVDTKFIESHRFALAEILDLLLPAESIDQSVARSQFARRYGFATKPAYVRFRLLDNVRGPLPGVRELMLRAEDFDRLAPAVGTVFIIENEVTYLAFPDVADAVVIFGSGYTLSGIAALPWLAARRVRYWGDLDTHGFAILNQLRARLLHVESMLMDRTTLLEHRGQWVSEPAQVTTALPCLSGDEASLYYELVEDALGPSVRLEQERISFRSLERALGTDELLPNAAPAR